MALFSETPLMEITLRRYELPEGLSQRDTLKKICLSLGLLQPGDSRDVIVDILYVLEEAKKERKELSAQEIKDQLLEIRKKFGLSMNGTADSNIRRQLKRLRDLFLVEKIRNNYRILEFMSLEAIFEEKIKKIILDAIISRNKEYFDYYSEFEKKEKKEEGENEKKNE
jgi:DNA-binding transcriptional ArsR family regulator